MPAPARIDGGSKSDYRGPGGSQRAREAAAQASIGEFQQPVEGSKRTRGSIGRILYSDPRRRFPWSDKDLLAAWRGFASPGHLCKLAGLSRTRPFPGAQDEDGFREARARARDWYLVDASGKTLGRLASQIAMRLRGKHKPEFTPHVDCGDHIIVVNAEKVAVTGNKSATSSTSSTPGYLGNLKTIALGKLLAEHPERAIEYAVKGMLPKTILGRQMFRKLHVFAGQRASACGAAAEAARDLRDSMATSASIATGRRKSSAARVSLKLGKGAITVNGRRSTSFSGARRAS
jgi:large subunit ribosomal protein L13